VASTASKVIWISPLSAWAVVFVRLEKIMLGKRYGGVEGGK
jgi:hypothetical protein